MPGGDIAADLVGLVEESALHWKWFTSVVKEFQYKDLFSLSNMYNICNNND